MTLLLIPYLEVFTTVVECLGSETTGNVLRSFNLIYKNFMDLFYCRGYFVIVLDEVISIIYNIDAIIVEAM